ncbi:potassium channel AKT2/3 [Abeliophyllum distichum]|uniref:Potassium channel AKT2/3 n=1 Tax=Abeliophyllum distichum TaxID=126358 RepID=A0ABD1SSE7_9LAMI
MAARRNDLTVAKELLKHGLHVNSNDRHGLTAIQVVIAENHVDMARLFMMNGAEANDTVKNKISPVNLNEMLQKREVGHRISMLGALDEDVLRKHEKEQDCNGEKTNLASINMIHHSSETSKYSISITRIIIF